MLATVRRNFIPTVVTALVFLISFTTVAHAAGAVEPANGSLFDLMHSALSAVLSAFQQGHYLYAGSISIVFGVAALRRYGAEKWKWMATDFGSALLVVLGSFFGSLAAYTANGASPTWGMFWASTKIAVGAIGGYTGLKHLVVGPYLRNLADKGPAWLHKPLGLVLWVFETLPSGNSTPAPDAQ